MQQQQQPTTTFDSKSQMGLAKTLTQADYLKTCVNSYWQHLQKKTSRS